MAHDDAGAIAVSYSDGLSLRLLDPPKGEEGRGVGTVPCRSERRTGRQRRATSWPAGTTSDADQSWRVAPQDRRPAQRARQGLKAGGPG